MFFGMVMTSLPLRQETKQGHLANIKIQNLTQWQPLFLFTLRLKNVPI